MSDWYALTDKAGRQDKARGELSLAIRWCADPAVECLHDVRLSWTVLLRRWFNPDSRVADIGSKPLVVAAEPITRTRAPLVACASVLLMARYSHVSCRCRRGERLCSNRP